MMYFIRNLTSLVFVPIVMFLGWFGSTTPVFACSCVSMTLSEQFDSATAVFVGKVIDIDSDGGNYSVDFEVSETRKGSNAEITTVTTHQQSSACGFEFDEGKEYIVYAYGEEGELGTGICTGTSLVAESQVGNGGSEIPIGSVESKIDPEKKENFIANIAIAIGFGLFYVDLIFQIRRLLQTRSSRDVSVRGVSIRLLAAILFQIKYFAVGDAPLMLGGIVFTALVAIYAVLAYRFRKSL